MQSRGPKVCVDRVEEAVTSLLLQSIEIYLSYINFLKWQVTQDIMSSNKQIITKAELIAWGAQPISML